MMTNYYNEFDPKAARWLQELMDNGLIPQGFIDTRSITQVRSEELEGYTQCHFFAGIGGWSLALQLAGVPEDTPLWTGSCPCQPFSSAGKHKGVNDERHLWPAFFSLIQERKPPVIFGEQVETAIKHGWLDGVSTDLESADYAIGSAVLPASSIGAPHIRKRLWFVAQSHQYSGNKAIPGGYEAEDGSPKENRANLPESGEHWGTYSSLPGRDGRLRRCEPGVSPMVGGFPQGGDLLRGYGNAIVPQVAAVFIQSFMEVTNDKNK